MTRDIQLENLKAVFEKNKNCKQRGDEFFYFWEQEKKEIQKRIRSDTEIYNEIDEFFQKYNRIYHPKNKRQVAKHIKTGTLSAYTLKLFTLQLLLDRYQDVETFKHKSKTFLSEYQKGIEF